MKLSYIERNGIHLMKIDNEKGFYVLLSKIGASIYSINYEGKDMTLTPISLKDYFNKNAYYGKTIGPITNRIKDGLVNINGVQYQMDKNEKGITTLHSGKNGISNAVFDVSNIIEKKDHITVIFKFIPHKQYRDLPGAVIYQISFTVSDKSNSLYVTFNAMSDEDTVIAMTNHAYFTLGDNNINDLSLKISSKEFIETDKDTLIPLSVKPILPCLDFNEGKLLMKDINDPYLINHLSNGYDHHFIFDKERKVILKNKNYQLEINTDFSGTQIYSDNYPDNIEMTTTREDYHRGVAIEPQDSTLDRKILKAGEMYSRYIEYKFSKI